MRSSADCLVFFSSSLYEYWFAAVGSCPVFLFCGYASVFAFEKLEEGGGLSVSIFNLIEFNRWAREVGGRRKRRSEISIFFVVLFLSFRFVFFFSVKIGM